MARSSAKVTEPRSGKKVIFFYKVEGPAVDCANSWTNSVATNLILYKTTASDRLVANAVSRLDISLERQDAAGTLLHVGGLLRFGR